MRRILGGSAKSARSAALAGIALTALSLPVSAQDPERRHDERSDLLSFHSDRLGAPPARAGSDAVDPELDRLADRIAIGARRQYEEAARDVAAPPSDCRDPVAVADHQRALRALGRIADCTQWVATCERQRLAGTPGLAQVLSAGARCASAEDQLARAYEWHERATRPENAASHVYPGLVYVFARFAHLTEHVDEVPRILARNPAWSGSKLPVVHGSLEYLLAGDTTRAPEGPIRSELLQWMAEGDPLLRQVAAVDWGWDLLWHRGRGLDSARFFAEKGHDLTSPEVWWPTALAALYSSVRGNDFAPVRRVYEATLPYLHPDSSLPTQRNPYTYSELYGGVCRTRLTSGSGAERYQAIQHDWLGGRLSASRAWDDALRLQSTEGERADILTLLGALAEDLGRDGEARDWYWRAHQACPYFNRAHDGLANVQRRRLARAWSDHHAIEARADRETRAALFTPDVRHLVGNWRSLSDEARKKLLHGLRFWAPYVDFLVEKDARIYFKRAPERMSDIAGFAGLRDRRYFDNRLLDDMGGYAQSRFAVINLAAATESPFFGGDITAHEVAHLFHLQLPAAQGDCIRALYRSAVARNLLASQYASTTVLEYFAVGVEVFLTAADAAPRFGPNVGWLQRNDPDLVRFLEQIAEGREPSTLTCPVR